MNEMSPRSDTALTLAGIGWFVRALGWCLLGLVLVIGPKRAWAWAVARAMWAMKCSEACFERRAQAKP